ncbi:MAG TPA: hypothetical protein VLD19_07665 [Chitinophagaceae bacterium]|nr:hypothetical protein [Chitinophagaceae bacterium]
MDATIVMPIDKHLIIKQYQQKSRFFIPISGVQIPKKQQLSHPVDKPAGVGDSICHWVVVDISRALQKRHQRMARILRPGLAEQPVCPEKIKHYARRSIDCYSERSGAYV